MERLPYPSTAEYGPEAVLCAPPTIAPKLENACANPNKRLCDPVWVPGDSS